MNRPIQTNWRNGFTVGLLLLAVIGTACSGKTKRVSPLPCSVAILPFEENRLAINSSLAGWDQTLTDQIAMIALTQPNVHLIDREYLEKILAELSLSSRDIADPENRLRLGKLMGARYFIMGGYLALEDRVQIDIRGVEIESGLTQSVSVQGILTERKTLEEAFSKTGKELLIRLCGDSP